MRKPSLSLDTFVAALALVGVSAASACSKAERAGVAPEPPSAAAASAVAPAAAAPPDQAPQPPTSTGAAASPVRAVAVDGGVKRGSDDDAKKKAGMSCGAGMCSADMKKGNGN